MKPLFVFLLVFVGSSLAQSLLKSEASEEGDAKDADYFDDTKSGLQNERSQYNPQKPHGIAGNLPNPPVVPPEVLEDQKSCLKQKNGKILVGRTVNKQVLKRDKIQGNRRSTIPIEISKEDIKKYTGITVDVKNAKGFTSYRWSAQCNAANRAQKFQFVTNGPVTGYLDVEYYGNRPSSQPPQRAPSTDQQPQSQGSQRKPVRRRPANGQPPNKVQPPNRGQPQEKLCLELTEKEARVGQTRGLRLLQKKQLKGKGSADLTYQLTAEERQKYSGIRVDLSNYKSSGLLLLGGMCSRDDEKRAQMFRLMDNRRIDDTVTIEFYGKA